MLLPTDKGSTKTLCFDCRAMGEPQDTEDRHHFGTHPALLNRYASDPKLQEHVQQLRREIEICKNSGVANIRLIVFDKRGRWAAMSVGKAFAEIAVNTQSLTLRSVSFLMHYHDRDCKGCDKCAFWTRRWTGCIVFSKRMVELYEATKLARTAFDGLTRHWKPQPEAMLGCGWYNVRTSKSHHVCFQSGWTPTSMQMTIM